MLSPLKTSFVNACLHLGFAVAKRSDLAAVRDLIAKVHPVDTEYGLIRLGDHGDGGYLVPDDLTGIVACSSPGVDNRASFGRDGAPLVHRDCRATPLFRVRALWRVRR
jgi:hypothetical protein